jgi:periplasmic protein TonB
MLHLLESAGHPRPQSTGWTAAVSATAHASLIAIAAVVGTREVITRPTDPAPPERVVYAAPRTPVSAPSRPPSGAPIVTPTITIPQRIVASFTDVVDRFIPQRLTEIPIGPAGSGTTVMGPVNGPPGDGIYTERGVDRAVLPLPTNRSPEYPAMLRSANVQGDVLVRFVVDTLGRVEPGSIEIHRTTHQLFTDAVRQWLVKNRYSPATIGGAPVRQMVEQKVEFTLR